MSGSELEGQRREIFGDDIARCDICGAPVPAEQLTDIEGRSALADHDHADQVCPNCLGRARSGEIDIESFVAPEDEPQQRDDTEW